METQKIYVQHEENNEWMNKLLFYKDEIKVLTHRLEEIVSKNTSKDILTKLEHHQNQLIIANNTIEKLKHEINISNHLLNDEIKNNIVAVDRRRVEDHSKLREDIKQFEDSIAVIKKSLNAFASKWM